LNVPLSVTVSVFAAHEIKQISVILIVANQIKIDKDRPGSSNGY